VVFTGEGKHFSTGFDLDTFFKGAPRDTAALMDGAVRLLGRLLALCLPSAAAINGHAFGMGALLALACDYRVMRQDRGFFCLPEIDLKVPIPQAMTELLKMRLQPSVLRDLLLSGRRIGGDEALRLGFIDAACGSVEVVPEAVALVTALAAKDRATFGAMKRGMHHAALCLIHETP
jgi:enoyl-CoA hydratase/carnithine racemase